MNANKSNKIAAIFWVDSAVIGWALLHGYEVPLDGGDIRQVQAVN